MLTLWLPLVVPAPILYGASNGT
ncbi:hypothetical protein MexAM1_META2p0093 (plasmid) [Methylorubrum extorquens AM1]|uniref:Uncharacterized protein n=1 Tax=Methylorubrum extorquens (strain ATCC 14718 / DSM 1338 / JCM 2805 / NCIMB 9133 / AM1) TaxID=272630 RepID=C5B3J1_METEA|nr:hypothetical protein MexAM1_META2p0093 [Methylorubrum extorquens AM1]